MVKRRTSIAPHTHTEWLLATGREEGIEIGYQQGFTDGFTKGFAEGFKESFTEEALDNFRQGYISNHTDGQFKARIEHIINSIKAGVDIKVIAKVFYCAEDYVREIAKENLLTIE